MNRLLLAMTGWGKSWYGQAIMEANAPEYDLFVVADYKDEYRGLVKSRLAEHMIVGPQEASLSVGQWKQVLADNPSLVLARYSIDEERWRAVISRVTAALRQMCRSGPDGFLAFDEAHFLAPQRGTVPEPIKGVATTGRGEGVSSLWMTQRPAEMEETVMSQCGERVIGGFMSDQDLSKIEPITEYPSEIHNPQASLVSHAPDELQTDPDEASGGATEPLRKFEEGGQTVGSEWIFSDDSGALERRDTRDVSMRSTHYGPEGRGIADP